MYSGIEVEQPYGKERIIVCDNSNYDLKETLEMMTISPERKIMLKTSDKTCEVITVSNIFNLLNLDSL
jgi:hypothetical protein